MASSQDTEITLGTAKLLGLFFGLVIVCAVFFALGYTLGRKADVGLAATSAAVPSTVRRRAVVLFMYCSLSAAKQGGCRGRFRASAAGAGRACTAGASAEATET